LLKFLDDRAASIPSRPHDGNHTFRSLARVGTNQSLGNCK